MKKKNDVYVKCEMVWIETILRVKIVKVAADDPVCKVQRIPIPVIPKRKRHDDFLWADLLASAKRACRHHHVPA